MSASAPGVSRPFRGHSPKRWAVSSEISLGAGGDPVFGRTADVCVRVDDPGQDERVAAVPLPTCGQQGTLSTIATSLLGTGATHMDARMLGTEVLVRILPSQDPEIGHLTALDVDHGESFAGA